MKVKLSVSELQSLSAVMVLAAEAIKQDAIPSREGEDEPIMNHRNANVKAAVKSLAKTKPI